MAKGRNLSEEIILTHELAEIFGCSPRWVNQLTTNNLLTQVGRGKYKLGDAIREYIAAIKLQAEESDDQETDLRAEQTMLTRANRKMAELELAVMNGDLHRSEDVKSIMNEMLVSFRSRMLTIPARATPEITASNDANLIQQVIKREVYDALSELSDYDPAQYYEKGKERIVGAAVKSSGKDKPKEKPTRKATAK